MRVGQVQQSGRGTGAEPLGPLRLARTQANSAAVR